MDVYDKMAEFLVRNNFDSCDICKAIDINGDNSCCDDIKWCIVGIAEYLREKEVLQ